MRKYGAHDTVVEKLAVRLVKSVGIRFVETPMRVSR